MQTYQSFRELKAAARRSLSGHYGNAIIILINVTLMSLLPANLIAILFSGNSIFSIAASEIAGILLTALAQILQVGVCLFYLKLHCNQPTTFLDIFHGFRTNRNQALGVGLVFTLVSYVCLLPATYFTYFGSTPTHTLDVRLLQLVTLAGTFVSTLLLLPFRQSFYILLDFPNYTAREALRFSMRIMKGNYLRCLLFQFSFIPLVFLSLLSCGIGLLWVLPYMEASMAAFYMDLVQKYKQS